MILRKTGTKARANGITQRQCPISTGCKSAHGCSEIKRLFWRIWTVVATTRTSDNSVGKSNTVRPAAFESKTSSNQAVALFTFEAGQLGDLGFNIITVITKTNKAIDWGSAQE